MNILVKSLPNPPLNRTRLTARALAARYADTMKPISLGLTLLYALSGTPAAAAVTSNEDPCENFFRALKAVPNQKLTRKTGQHESFFDGKRYTGCEIEFVTEVKLLPNPNIIPSFSAAEGTDLYRSGWRKNSSYVADAGGSSAFGLREGEFSASSCMINRILMKTGKSFKM